MSKLKNILLGTTLVAGLGLAGHAFFQKDGTFDRKDVIEYGAGIGLAYAGAKGLSYKPKKNYGLN